MITFLKDSIREIKHVVWPTKAETKKYFLIVISVLVTFGLYLFAASTAFSSAILYLKDLLK